MLDDATSAVDVKVEVDIHTALLELMKHRTTILIAHRLSTISLADRVVLLDEGKIVASGTHQELMRTESRYRDILAQQGRIHDEVEPETEQDESDVEHRRRIAEMTAASVSRSDDFEGIKS